MMQPNEPADQRDPRYTETTDPGYGVYNAAPAPMEPVQPVTPARRRVDDAAYAPSWRGWRAAQIIYTLGGIVEALIVIRLILKLLAANPDAGFTSLIYTITNPLVGPFQGVFVAPRSNGSVVDLAAILAIIVYALLTWLVARLFELIQRRSGGIA
jgi:uncharacterized protein YggT (Ycf19 family)